MLVIVVVSWVERGKCVLGGEGGEGVLGGEELACVGWRGVEEDVFGWGQLKPENH